MLLLIVKFNVAIESHPFALVSVAVYAPEVVYVIELAAQVYVSHAVTDSDPEVGVQGPGTSELHEFPKLSPQMYPTQEGLSMNGFLFP